MNCFSDSPVHSASADISDHRRVDLLIFRHAPIFDDSELDKVLARMLHIEAIERTPA